MAANLGQKTPFARSMERFAQQRALDAYNLRGKGLPCTVASVSGSIVTVNFDVDAAPFTLSNVTVPMFGPEYIRYPTQVGDKGVVIPFDVLLGAISGLGGNVAALDLPPSNLGALVFSALSNVNWSPTDDANAVVIYGPSGVIMRDAGKTSTITVAPGMITLSAGGHEIVISSAGVVIDGITFAVHMHTGVTAGGANTGPVL